MNARTTKRLNALLPPMTDIIPLIAGSPRSLYASVGTPSIPRNRSDQHYTIPSLTAGLHIRRCLDASAIEKLYVKLRSQALRLDPTALNDLGWMWMTGTHLVTNQARARELLKLAAAQGSAEANFNLAERAYYGKGCRVNIPRAIAHYADIAANCKIVALRTAAASALARIYRDGELDGKPDPGAAINWYQRAIDLGDKSAVIDQCEVKLVHDTSFADIISAVLTLQNAALEGLIEASHFLAELYADQKPILEYPSDPDKRMQRFWRELALEQEAAAALEASPPQGHGHTTLH